MLRDKPSVVREKQRKNAVSALGGNSIDFFSILYPFLGTKDIIKLINVIFKNPFVASFKRSF